jgi:hypothetical protein
MLDVIMSSFIALFGMAAGFVAMSCTSGAKHNVVLGLGIGTAVGALFGARAFLDADTLGAGLIFGGSVAGSVIAALLDESNGLKRYIRKNIGLSIKVAGKDKIGK